MRHLYNISKLPPNQQSAVANHIRNANLTATETEQLLAHSENRPHRTGLPARQCRFHTPTADVLITFNKPGATNADVGQVLEVIRHQLADAN